MLKSRVIWSARVPWDEACRRAGGRRRLLGVKRIKAAARRHRLLKLLRRDGLRYGQRIQFAKIFQVSPATITADLHRIWQQYPPGSLDRHPTVHLSGGTPRHPHQEPVMSARVTLRLPTAVLSALQRLAEQQERSLSALIREQLCAMVGGPEPGAADGRG
jgi:Ribbon-helix-helix protein, copG family